MKSEFSTWLEQRESLKVHESEVDMWIVIAKCLEMIAGTSMFVVCRRPLSRRRITEYREADCSRKLTQKPKMNALLLSLITR